MERLREVILETTLWISLVLATIAYVPGVWASLQSGIAWLAVVDTVLWAAILVLALWRTLPFPVRAIAFLVPWFLFSLLLIWLLGPAGAGILWLMATPILAALFFGYRGAVGGLVLLVLVSVLYPFLLPFRAGLQLLDTPEASYNIVSWSGSAGSLLFIATLVSLALAELLRRLENTLQHLDQSNRRLTRIMREREELQEQVLQTQKHSALGTLAAGIAHDFNNLLVPLQLSAEQALTEANADSDQEHHLTTILHSSRRARQLVQRILRYSRDDSSGTREAVPLEPLLQDVNALLRSSAHPAITMYLEVDDPSATVLADEDALHQVLMNLGTNACLAMPEGGTLTWHLTAPDRANEIHLHVCDTGSGIDPAIQSRIFDPFFTTREPGSGTGLGLSIVRRLVTDLNGRIDVESDGESGTCFHLVFPAAEPEIDRSRHDNAPLTAPVRLRILVVDDEDLVRGTLMMILRQAGHTVQEAASPESALRELQGGECDLLITDLAMPGMNGIALVDRVRSQLPELPVLMLSGHFSEDDTARLDALGVRNLLHKPFSRADLEAAVQQACMTG